MKKIAETVFFILIGYTIALMIRYAMPAQRKKVALAGVIGAFVGKGKWQAIFAGVAGYDIAEEAGLSPYQEKALAGLTKTKGNPITIEIADQAFTYIQSDWLPIFSFNKDAPQHKWRSIIGKYFSLNQSEEVGIYCLRQKSSKAVRYVGISYSPKHGLERVIRHFQEGTENTGISHAPYKNRDNWEVKFYQIDNPTKERLELFEWWVHEKLKPTDSNPQSSAIKIVFNNPEQDRADQLWNEYNFDFRLTKEMRENAYFDQMLKSRADELQAKYDRTGEVDSEMQSNPYFVPF